MKKWSGARDVHEDVKEGVSIWVVR
jgi:1,2-phenylacetyl-CoA epoxidase PaaB subunit